MSTEWEHCIDGKRIFRKALDAEKQLYRCKVKYRQGDPRRQEIAVYLSTLSPWTTGT